MGRSRVFYTCTACGWRGLRFNRIARPRAQAWPLTAGSPDFAKLDAAFRIDNSDAEPQPRPASDRIGGNSRLPEDPDAVERHD
jgi:hypothetical protein